MNVKCFTLSIFIHILVFIGLTFYNPTKQSIIKVGNPIKNVSVSLRTSKGNSNITKPKDSSEKNVHKPIKKHIKESVLKKSTLKKQVVVDKKIVHKVVKPTTLKPKIIEKKVINNPVAPKVIANNTKKKETISKKIPSESKITKISSLNKGKNSSSENNDENLVEISTGKYALKNQRIIGLNYNISNKVNPVYPEIFKKMGIKENVVVKVKFLVDEKGHIKDTIFYGNYKNEYKYEVKKALNQWKFKPVLYKGKPTPYYFFWQVKFET